LTRLARDQLLMHSARRVRRWAAGVRRCAGALVPAAD
jgi:hypothetical protein